MRLPILFKIFAVLHFLVGLLMLFGGSMLSSTNGWEHSVGIATMAEHHGSSLICVSILFWMLPNWLDAEKLNKTVPVAILIQVILAIMPVYHAAVGAIPTNGALFVMMAIIIGLIILFFLASKKEISEE
ncbi:MAG: hypothetical protein P8L82_03450 [Paracoccaceae bacterium]|nr:hypothetical protein [Paracoccaceae bacterium]